MKFLVKYSKEAGVGVSEDKMEESSLMLLGLVYPCLTQMHVKMSDFAKLNYQCLSIKDPTRVLEIEWIY